MVVVVEGGGGDAGDAGDAGNVESGRGIRY
jgi:hypothetical protein